MNKFKKRGYDEIETLSLSQHIIGRTDWDYTCVHQINPNITYHFCNETLREKFYVNKWDTNKKVTHRLFTSQAYYPIKGFHYLIEAIHLLVKKYPDLTLHVAGDDIFSVHTMKDYLKQSSYAKYINALIKKYKLEKSITFTGVLSEEQMIDEYLSSHTFVMPSVIENSPNSIGEAMILGVPTVSSFVGGVNNVVDHGINGFYYQHDAPYMLAHYIDKLWQDDQLTKLISSHGIEKALSIYHPEKNKERLLEIYSNILST
jgi:glycosyltransferase involved in cell wall biosynthesis